LFGAAAVKNISTESGFIYLFQSVKFYFILFFS